MTRNRVLIALTPVLLFIAVAVLWLNTGTKSHEGRRNDNAAAAAPEATIAMGRPGKNAADAAGTTEESSTASAVPSVPPMGTSARPAASSITPTPRGAKPDQVPEQWRAIAAHMAPEVASADAWKKAVVLTRNAATNKVPCKIALNILPLLEADKNINSRHVSLRVTRSETGALTTEVWGHKAQKTLIIDWNKGEFSQRPHREDAGMELDESPREERYSHYDLVLSDSRKDGKPIIALWLQPPAIQNSPIEIPYVNYTGFTSLGPYVSKNYPIAALPKVKATPHEFASIILVDVPGRAVLGEIELPEGARDTRPVFALDKVQNVLIGAGYDLQWMSVMDLQGQVSRNPNR